MTIQFHEWSTEDTDGWDNQTLYEIYQESRFSPFETVDQFADILELTLVGVEMTMARPRLGELFSTQAETLDDMARHVFDEVMAFRLERRNSNDLKVTLQSDFSPEGEAAAVSRVFKQPGRS